MDLHAWRQTQTAISAEYMVREPWSLAYQTPVMGPPWSIPFEFPLYQGIVAVLCKLTAAPLEPTGRFVSFLFFWLTTIPLYFVLKHLTVERKYRFVFLGLFVTSPFYVFWGRSFMIETTALCLAVAYLAAVFSYRRDRRPGWMILAAVLGSLAALTKVTTVATFLVAAAIVLGQAFWQKMRRGTSTADKLGICLGAVLVLGVPVVFGAAWTGFTDVVKQQSAVGYCLTSKALAHWNYGTLGQRLSPGTWRIIFGRAMNMMCGRAIFWVAVLAVLAVTRRRWKEAAICVALYGVAPLLFTNLYYVHDYYQCANGIFLVAALGYVLVGVYEFMPNPLPGIICTVAALLSAIGFHVATYSVIQRANVSLHVPFTNRLARETPPESVVITWGGGWDPVVPYYAQRRALMFPDGDDYPLTDDAVRGALERVKKTLVGAVVFRPSTRYRREHVEQLLSEVGIHPLHTYTTDEMNVER